VLHGTREGLTARGRGDTPCNTGGCRDKKKGYTAHKQLRCNGPQANDGTQQMDRKGRQIKTPLQKGSKRTLSVPEEGLRNGAGSTKHATLARLQKGLREGNELEASWNQCT